MGRTMDGFVVAATLIIMGAAMMGWVMNIIKIAMSLSEPLTLLLGLRALGVFILPIGCVLGWF